MGHLAAILFFLTLLVALATILDLMVRADWALIAAALRGPSSAPRPVARARRAALASPPRRHAAS